MIKAVTHYSTTTGELNLYAIQQQAERRAIRYSCNANPRRVRQYVVGPVAVDVWCDDGLEESYGQQLVTWELPLRIISTCHGPRELPR